MNARGVAHRNAVMLLHADHALYGPDRSDRVLIGDAQVFVADLPDRLRELRTAKAQFCGEEGDGGSGFEMVFRRPDQRPSAFAVLQLSLSARAVT